MADNTSGLIKLAAFGAAGYLAYKYVWPMLQTSAPATLAPGTPAATNTTPPAPPPSAPPAPSVTVAQIGTKTWQAAAANNNGVVPNLSPDDWNAIAVQQGAPVFPDPIPLYGNRNPMSFDTWWSQARTVLVQNGLSGIVKRYRAVRVR